MQSREGRSRQGSRKSKPRVRIHPGRQRQKQRRDVLLSENSIPRLGSAVNPPQPPPGGDLCLLLSKSRRLYDLAVSAGDWTSAAKHQAIYDSLFERRRAILLAQARGSR